VAERAVYIEAAKRAGFRVTGYFFDAKVRDALRRNAQRMGAGKIPAAAVAVTLKRLERPSPNEGFHELYVVLRDEAEQFVVSAWSDEERARV